ncbi:nitroreductase/quinone reductase family protein [Streptosporangium saharense]|uniref:nitroreductase/quinone reductase family protein n=1 Tax=Streptosporangium saharense TaxID=1706840 RepID=UPI0034243260
MPTTGRATRNPDRYFNLRSDPHVELRGGAVERAAWWERAVAVYPAYTRYQEEADRVIPVFVLDPGVW